ncbi:hypothetical protein PIB30_069308, partial [Stylosanthes scabra]|nr:hypothetical protein [Stylosanthes scabra]
MLGLQRQRTIESSKRLWGLCFHVGQRLTSRLMVAAGGPPANVPATNLGYSQEKRKEPPYIIIDEKGCLRSGPAGWSSGEVQTMVVQ